jgi:transposase
MAGSKSRTSASTGAATDDVTRVEIVTRGEGRREYTPDERATVLTEAAQPGARVLLVAQRYGLSPSLVYRWRREAAGRPARQTPPRAPRFVPLLVEGDGILQNPVVRPGAATQDAGADRIEVVLPNGRLLRVGAGADAAAVARLAAALEA